MKKYAIPAILTAIAIVATLGACGKQEPTKTVTDPNTFYGTFFSMVKPEGTNPIATGHNVAFNGDKLTVLVNVTQIPGTQPGNLDSVKAVLATDNTAYENVTQTESEINGVKGIKFEGSLSGRKVAGWACAIDDAVVTVKHVPFDDADGKLTAVYEASLATFTLTNPQFFKGAPILPPIETPNATPEDFPNSTKPVVFENDYVKFTAPRDWEISSTIPDSIIVSPSLENSMDAGQGITVDIINKHNKASDLEFAQSHGSTASLKKYGKTEFATFTIAQAGLQVFIVSTKDKTVMITISTTSATLSKKLEDFLGSVELK